jgi:hypothetical protein
LPSGGQRLVIPRYPKMRAETLRSVMNGPTSGVSCKMTLVPQRLVDFARLAIAHRPQRMKAATILRDPIDQGMAEDSKFVRGHPRPI